MVSRVYHLTANTTIAANPPLAPGTRIEYVFVQDATGGRTVTWDSTFNDAPQPDQAANAVSLIEFISVNGTNWRYDGPLFSVPWSTTFQASGGWIASAAAGTYLLGTAGDATLSTAAIQPQASPAAATTPYGAPALFPLDPADYAISTKVVQIRLVSTLITTAALTAGNANTIQFGIYPVTAISTAGVPTLGAVTLQNTAIVNQAASTFGRQTSSALTMPAAGMYVLGATTSAGMSSTQASVPHYSAMVQVRVL